MANRNNKLKSVFGTNKYGLPDLPKKVSNVKIARLKHTEDRGGCSRCFPHGPETTNVTNKNKRRSWKNYRLNNWK